MAGQFERTERETMKQSPQGQKLNICTYTKVNIYIFYIGPILSIYLHWICTGDGITLHTLYIYLQSCFFKICDKILLKIIEKEAIK